MEEVIKLLGGLGILVAALSWLARSLLTHWMTKDLDAHKERLAHESAREIEGLRAELQALAREHEIRFEALHAVRAGSLVDLYGSLEQALAALESLAEALDAGFVAVGNEVESVSSCVEEAGRRLSLQRLHLARGLSDRIDAFIRQIGDRNRELRQRLVDKLYIGEGTPDDAGEKEAIKAFLGWWGETDERLREELSEIESEFRDLLGSESRDRGPAKPIGAVGR